MSGRMSRCLEIEPVLAAVATGEGDAAEAARAAAHLDACGPCRTVFERYRDVGRAVAGWGGAVEAPPSAARARLAARLADLRARMVLYHVFPSPLGNLLIARSEEGVALVEYLDRDPAGPSRRLQSRGIEAIEDGAAVAGLYRELMEYLEHQRTRLEWSLDLRFTRSDFHRRVLTATAAIPYGAVISYAGIAGEIGRPAAVRAVAQALRWNPLPIVVPCHRVVGTSGALTGYAGHRVGLKQRLLALEGVAAVRGGSDVRISREAMYVRTLDGAEYCRPTCGWLARGEERHRIVRFGSRASAEAAGLAPCAECRPDLHPVG